MSYIPSITPITEKRLPHKKWKTQIYPSITKAFEGISFPLHVQQTLLAVISGSEDPSRNDIDLLKIYFKKLNLDRKFRGYLFSFMCFTAAKNANHLVTIRDLMACYKGVFGSLCHSDYPNIVANYLSFYVLPTDEAIQYSPAVCTTEIRGIKVADMLLSVSKSKRKVAMYNKEPLFVATPEQTLAELDESNRELEKTDMEWVFQFAQTNGLFSVLIKELQTSTPDLDLQRSVDLFIANAMVYEFFTFMRSKGIAIA